MDLKYKIKSLFSLILVNAIIVFILLSSSFISLSQTTEIYNVPGSITWICPPGVTSVTIQCWGAGGGGGNSANTYNNGGHGGGGGAFSESTFSVTSGQTYYLFVGAGGIGGQAFSTASAGDGQDTWFNIVNSIPTNISGILAKGGRKGPNNTTSNIVNRGEAVLGFGTIKYSGGNGRGGYSLGGRGGGSSAGIFSDGTNASSVAGALAPSGGGNGGNGSTSSTTNGQPGFPPGGGGGGSDDWPARTGGSGGNGQIVLNYTPNCFGIPVIPSISATPSSGCGTVVLYATGQSNEPGMQFQWQSSIDNLNWSNINGATSLTHTAFTNASMYYRLLSICIYGDTSISPSTLYTFSGNSAQPSPSVISETIECGQTASLSASGGGSSNYYWFSDPSANNLVATGPSYTTPALNATTSYYVASGVTPQYQQIYLISIADLVNLPFDCGTGSIYGSGNVGFNWTDILPPSVNITSISAELSIGSECTPGFKNTTLNGISESSFSTISNCSCTGSSAQTISLSPSNYLKGGLNQFRITNASSFGFNSTNLNFDGSFARITVNYNVVTPCYSDLSEVSVAVIPSSTAGVLSSSQTICYGTSPSSLSFSGISGNIQWQVSSDSLNWSNIVGDTSTTLLSTQIGVLTNDTFYRLIVSNAGCSSVTSNVVKITINPLPIVEAGPDQFVCSGSSIVLSGSGAQSYGWSGGATNGQPFTVTSTETFTVIGTDMNNCSNSDQIVVTVSSQSNGGTASSNQNFCVSGTPSSLVLSGQNGSIQWQESIDNSNWDIISGATASNLTSAQMGGINQTTFYRASVTNGVCPSAVSNTVTINVYPNSVSGTAGPSQIICSGTQPADIALTGQIGTVQWFFSSSSTGPWTIIPGAINPTLSSAQMGVINTPTYYRATITSGVCAPTNSNLVLVNVTPSSVAGTVSGSQTICSGGSVILSLSGNTGSIQWQSSVDNINFSNISGANSANYFSANLTATTFFRAEVTNGFCITVYSNIATVTVNQVSVGVIGTDQTICSGSLPAALTFTTTPAGFGTLSYQWQSSTNATTWGNIIGATGPALSSAQMGSLTATRYYRVIVTSTSGVACTETSNMVTVLVNSINPGVIGNTQINCYDYNPDDLLSASFSYCTTPTTVEAITPSLEFQNTNTYASGSRAFTFYGVAGCSYTFSTCGSTTMDTYLRLYSGITGSQITFNDNACGLQSQIVWTCPTNGIYSILLTRLSCASLTTNVFLKYSSNCTTPCAQTFCNSGDPDSLYFESPSSALGAISYQWQSSTDNNTWTNIIGEDTLGYDPLPITTTTYYRVLVTSEINGVFCSTPTNVAASYVNNPGGGVINGNQTICSGSIPVTFGVISSASGLGVLSYQWESSTDSLTWNTVLGATAATYTSIALTQPTYFRRIVSATYNGLVCTAYSNVINVTINQVDSGTIGNDQTICSGGDPDSFVALVGATGSGTLSYQWQTSANGTTSWTNILGATSSVYDVPTGQLTTRYYRVIVTSTLNGVVCSSTSNTVVVTVNNVTAGSIATNQTICSGGSPAAFTSSSAGSGSGILSYQWQTSSDNISWSNIPGATAATYTAPGPITSTTYYRRLRISALNGVVCSANSNTLTVTVNQVSAGVIGTDQTICSGSLPAALTFTTTPAGFGTLSYQWQSSTNATTWGNIIGATGPALSSAQMGSLTATRYYRVIVTSTSGVACTETSNVVAITVNTINMGVIGSNQTICAESTPSQLIFTTSPSGVGALTYQWQSSINGTTWTNISGGNGSILTSAQMGTLTAARYYRVIVTSTLNGIECSITSNMITIAVNSSTPGTIGSNQNICSGGDPAAFTNVVSPSGTGTFTYQWQSSTNGVTWTNIAGATAITYNVPAGLSLSTYYRRLTSHTALGITCSQPTNTLFVGVYNAGTISSAQSICSGSQPSSLTVAGSIGNIQWQASTNGTTWTNISGATTATLTSAQMGALPSSRYYRVSITGVTCTPSLVSNSILITVLPLPPINAGPDTNVCSGNSVVLSASGGTSYSWNNGVINGVSFIPINTANYTVTGTGLNGCTNTDQMLVTVNPTPTADLINNNPMIICQGESFLLTSSVTNVSTYQWRLNGNNIAGANSSSYIGALAGIYTLFVSSPQGCSSISNPIAITITPLPTVNAGPDVSICQGQSIILTASGAANYTWNNGVANGSSFTPNATNIYTVSTTSPTTGCVGTDQVTVTVNSPSSSTIYSTSLGAYVLNGIEYSESGTYVQNTINQFGCDSTINLVLTVYNLGLAESNSDYFKIYPNPSLDGKFFIDWNENFTVTRLSVKDAYGKIKRQIYSKSNEIDLSELPAGLYFVIIESPSSQYVLKVVKL